MNQTVSEDSGAKMAPPPNGTVPDTESKDPKKGSSESAIAEEETCAGKSKICTTIGGVDEYIS